MGNVQVGNDLGEESQVGIVGIVDVFLRIVPVGIVLEPLI